MFQNPGANTSPYFAIYTRRVTLKTSAFRGKWLPLIYPSGLLVRNFDVAVDDHRCAESTGNQSAHSSNRRIISMSPHPNRMTEPHNIKGMP